MALVQMDFDVANKDVIRVFVNRKRVFAQGVVRPALDTTLPLMLGVRCKGKAFPSRHCKLENLTLCNQKTSMVSLFVREMFCLYKCRGRITREPDAVPVPSSQLWH